MSDELIVNFDRQAERSHLWARLKRLTGSKRITITDHRRRRTDRQLRYYFPCFCKPFARFMREHGTAFTDLDAHEFFKKRFNGKPVIDPRTGEIIDTIGGSTGELNTKEFNEYLDHVALYLFDQFEIDVPDPSVYHERDEA